MTPPPWRPSDWLGRRRCAAPTHRAEPRGGVLACRRAFPSAPFAADPAGSSGSEDVSPWWRLYGREHGACARLRTVRHRAVQPGARDLPGAGAMGRARVRALAGLTRYEIRCVWRYRHRFPGKDWRFPCELPKSSADISKGIACEIPRRALTAPSSAIRPLLLDFTGGVWMGRPRMSSVVCFSKSTRVGWRGGMAAVRSR
jgi:hypothetical protein